MYYSCQNLIDLLHGRLFIAIIVVLAVRDSIIIIGVVRSVDAETKLDKAVDALGENGGLVEREAGGEKRRVVKHPDEVLDSLVALVGLRLLAQLLDDGVEGVDLHSLLR